MTGLATNKHAPARHVATTFQPYPGANHLPPAAAPRSGQAKEPKLRHLRTTPGKVKAGVALIIVLTAALGVLTAITSARVTGGFTRMGGTDTPLVEASTGLYFAVSDMDAQLANVLLTGDNPTLAGNRQVTQLTFANDRATAEQELQRITTIAARDPVAQAAITTIMDVLGRYEALAADAMLVNARGRDPSGRPSATTRNYFEQATDLMTGRLLPAATRLTRANAGALTASYASDRATASAGIAETAALGVLVLIALAGLQVFLARRYRRLINPALVIATVLALAFTIAAGAALGDQDAKLHVAKADAFDSVLALTQARAISYAGNADESRYLTDAPRAATYQDAFLRTSQQITDVGSAGILQFDAALSLEISAYQADHSRVEWGGFLGTEFRNITFAGERAAAERTLRAWQVYQQDDRQLRALAASNLNAAIAFDIGTSPGQSDWAFAQYDAALGTLIAINEKAFSGAIAAGQKDGAGWSGPIPAGATAAIAALAIAGTRRRVAEYR